MGLIPYYAKTEVEMHEPDTSGSPTGLHVEVVVPLQVRIYVPRASNSSPWEEHNSLMEKLGHVWPLSRHPKCGIMIHSDQILLVAIVCYSC